MRVGSTPWFAPALCAALVILAGCGDDDTAPSDGGTGGGGVLMGGSGGTGSSTVDSGIKPLGDGVSGKACLGPKDCGGAMCAGQVAGGALQTVVAPGGYCTGPCATNADCGMGGACVGALAGIVNGQCFATCSADADCRDGYQCVAGLSIAGITVPSTCRPKPETNKLDANTAGNACKAATDCPGGTCVTMRGGFMGQGGTTLPGGYCSGACLEDADCGAGGVCTPPLISGLTGDCYQKCSSDGDCTRDGYRCRQIGQNLRGCDAFPDPLPDNTAGNACASDSDCGGVSGTCRTSLPPGGFAFGRTLSAPGGYCSQACAEAADCGAGGTCVGGGFTNGTCFKTCTAASDCRDGYVCEQRGGGMMMPATGDAGMSMPTLVCAPQMMMSDADAG